LGKKFGPTFRFFPQRSLQLPTRGLATSTKKKKKKKKNGILEAFWGQLLNLLTDLSYSNEACGQKFPSSMGKLLGALRNNFEIGKF